MNNKKICINCKHFAHCEDVMYYAKTKFDCERFEMVDPKIKYNSVLDYFTRRSDSKALEKAKDKPLQYYADNNIYDIIEELETK